MPGTTKGGLVYPLLYGNTPPASCSTKGSPWILFKSNPISSLISSPSSPLNNPFCNPRVTRVPLIIQINLNFCEIGSY